MKKNLLISLICMIVLVFTAIQPLEAVAGGGKGHKIGKCRKAKRFTYCFAWRVRRCNKKHFKVHCDNGVGNGPDCNPHGIQKNYDDGKDLVNDDDPGDAPGNPGNRRGWKRKLI